MNVAPTNAEQRANVQNDYASTSVAANSKVVAGFVMIERSKR